MRSFKVARLAFVAAIALLSADRAIASERAPLPQTQTGARLQEFLATFGKADTAGIRAFVERTYTDEYKAVVPIEARIQLFLDARSRGALEATELVADEGETVRVSARHAATREWRTIALTTEPAAEKKGSSARIKRIAVSFDWPRTVEEYLAASSPNLSSSQLERAVQNYVGALAKVSLFSGAVRLERAGKPIIDQAWGYADQSAKLANTSNTQFNLGSASKMWTAAAIMKLIKDGRLSLSAPLSKFDLGVPPPANANEITIAHLLSHTSGLGNYFGPKYDAADKATLDDIDDFLRVAVPLETAFKPGSDYSYSNAGFLVLGKIIELVSGKSYFDYVASEIFAPAGMKHSGCLALDEDRNMAIGYDRTQTDTGPVFETNVQYLSKRSVSAGGCYSTTADMMRFFDLLANGTFASSQTLATFTARHSPPQAEPYGYGFQLGADGEWWGHGGYFNGVGAVTRVYRKPAGWRVAILANHRDTAENLAQFLDAAIPLAQQ
jgi:CubicO group peptidase (beta-lactamase class C family)